ncbi:MAG: hypothetical protein RL172_1597 [Bacteroidota bacterium]|jgi:uncharacterized protein with FMN-binding domain
MKRLHLPLLLICVVLYGCPYESYYSIDKEPLQPVDENLLGKWATMVNRPAYEGDHREEAIKIILEKRSDMEYDISITGYLEELQRKKLIKGDTIKATGFISLVDGRQFMNTLLNGKVYIAEIKQQNNSIDILSLAEHFTNKFIKSSAELKTAISIHYKTKPTPVYDEWFIAKNLQRVN